MQHLSPVLSHLLVWTLSLTVLWGQPTYALETGREIGLAGSGVGLAATSLLLDRNVDPLTPEEVAALDIDVVPGIDRWSTRQFSPVARNTSDVLLWSSLAMPATLYLDQPARTEAGKVALMSLQAFLITTGVTNLVKTTVRRPRPFMYNEEVPMRLKLEKNSRYSFFSGHTSVTATMTFLSAKMYNDFYPDSSARPFVWATAAIIPAATGYLRMKGGKHYFTDVLVGYAVGAVVGVLVPQLHKSSPE